jgi:type I restriction enzyme S subunit
MLDTFRLTIGNVQYNGLDLNDLKHVSDEKAKQLERYILKEGDILFARMGTVGRCCVVPKEAEGWLINYHIIRVASDKSRVEPRFIHWIIQASADVSEFLDENIRGATRKGVNSKIVGSLPCRVPSLTQQRRIVAHLDDLQAQVDELTALQGATQVELDALLPSVLDRAFRGEL